MMRLNAARIEPGRAQPGDTLSVDLEWEALAPVGEDFTVLVHLVDRAQPSSQSLKATTSRWRGAGRPRWIAGHTFIDPHAVALPAALPPGEYALAIGSTARPISRGCRLRLNAIRYPVR